MATRMTKSELHELAHKVLAGYREHDAEAVVEALTDDIVWTEPEGTWHTKDEVAASIEGTFEGFPDSEWPEESAVVMPSDDHSTVAVTWRWQGTHTGPYVGLPATGKQVDVSGVSVAKVRDGLISEMTFHFDTYDFLEQLGVVPSTAGVGFKVLATAEIALGKAKQALHLSE